MGVGPSRRRTAGELERAVLDVLWSAGEPMTPGQVRDALAREGTDLAYTSIATTLTRLAAKGQADRTSAGRTYAYAPSARAAADIAARMRGLLGDGRARSIVLSHFVAGLDRADEETLLRLLAAAEPEKPEEPAGPSEDGDGQSPA